MAEYVIATVLSMPFCVTGARWAILWSRARKEAFGYWASKSRTFADIMRECEISVPTAEPRVIVRGGPAYNYSRQAMRERSKTDALAIPSAAGEAIITSAYMLRDMISVNKHFYDAISSMAGHQIHSFASLHASGADYKYSVLSGVGKHVVDSKASLEVAHSQLRVEQPKYGQAR